MTDDKTNAYATPNGHFGMQSETDAFDAVADMAGTKWEDEASIAGIQGVDVTVQKRNFSPPSISDISDTMLERLATKDESVKDDEHWSGKIVGNRYVLDEKLGRGSFGEVWRAYDRHEDRLIALKFMTSTSSRFGLAEAELGVQMTHPNIVTAYNVERLDAQVVLVMQLAPGRTLTRACSEGCLESHEVAKIGYDLIDALEFSHARGIVHRDIKPSNIIYQDNPYSLRVTDFGVAVRFQDMRRKRSTAGTYAYMAPEQLCGRVTPACDFWAVGAVLYHLLTRRVPFPSGSIEELSTSLFVKNPDLNRISDAVLQEAVRLLLDKDFEARMQMAPRAKSLLASMFDESLHSRNGDTREDTGVEIRKILQQIARRLGVWRGSIILYVIIPYLLARRTTGQESLQEYLSGAHERLVSLGIKGPLYRREYLRFLRHYCSIYNWNANVVSEYSNALICAGRLGTALKIVRRVRRSDPLHYRLMVLHAQLSYWLGRNKLAGNICAEILSEYGFSPEAEFLQLMTTRHNHP